MDALQCRHNWLNVLEGRVCALLDANNLEGMKPVEREQAASCHLMFMLRLLHLRQKYAQAALSCVEQALLEALLRESEEE